MTELMRHLSDDQLALLGCLGALGGALMLLSISFHSNPQNKGNSRSGLTPTEHPGADASDRDDEQRRAA